MTLTDREKFIHHFITLSTLRIIGKRINKDGVPIDINVEDVNITEEEKHDVDIILKTRCRKLTPDDVRDIFEDLSEEALLGGSVINDLIK
jgi:ribosome-interacting GTPase 1|tara:strand:+ start:12060 stop:12329 length:270 start_codon:yes stop_codon:yes gene_type:complete